MQLFGTTGQKKLNCRGTKGQRDKLKILQRDGTGRDSQNSGWDRPRQQKSRTGRWTKQDRAEKDVLKQENDVLKQKTGLASIHLKIPKDIDAKNPKVRV